MKVEFRRATLSPSGDHFSTFNNYWDASRFEQSVEDAFTNHRFRIFPLQKKKALHWKGDNCNCDCFVNGFHPKLDIEFGWWYEDYYIEVKANKAGIFMGSSAQLGGPKAWLDEHDVHVRYLTADGIPTWQIPAVHEFGHLLGLPHPGQYLPNPPAPNSPADYTADASALMGRGHEMRAIYFEKWKDELDTTYGKLGCTLSLQRKFKLESTLRFFMILACALVRDITFSMLAIASKYELAKSWKVDKNGRRCIFNREW